MTTLTVRELTATDIDLIADYWLHSSPEHLIGMGVDLNKLPERNKFREMLLNQINSTYKEKQSYALIGEVNGCSIGHCNINEITFGQHAKMHLHLWSKEHRQQGFGTSLVAQSIPIFFEKFQLKELYCEPYIQNDGPNKILKKLNFELIKSHITTPGSLNFEQEVNLWRLKRHQLTRN